MHYYLKHLLITALICGSNFVFTAQDGEKTRLDLAEETKVTPLGVEARVEAQSLADDILATSKATAVKQVDFIELSEIPILEMPLVWKERPDVFNPHADLLNLLRKSQIKCEIHTVNRTEAPIKLFMTRKVVGADSISSTLDIANGKYKNLEFEAVDSIESLTVSQGFLNVVTEGNQIFLTVEPKQPLLFPRPLAPFNFIPDLVELKKNAEAIEKNADVAEKKGKEMQDSDATESKKLLKEAETLKYRAAKIKEYIGHLGYLRWATARDEWVGDKKAAFQSDPLYKPLYQKRHDNYEEIRVEKLFNQPLPDNPRIQQNLFSIWLTNQSKPVEPSDEALELILGSAALNSKKDGWSQYLVVQDFVLQDPELFKTTRKKLEGSGVELTSYEKLIGKLELQDDFDAIIAKRKFAKASDLLRVELLHKLGGAYLDIDLVVLHPLKPLFYLYDSMFGIEPMSEFVCNAFMAANAGHPIMREMLDLMARNFKLKAEGKTEFYSASVVDENDGFDTILQTGPCMTTVAVHNKSGIDGRRDLLAPSELFYPAVTLNRPEARIPNIDDAVALNSATLHLWRTTWAGEKGKKNGCFG